MKKTISIGKKIEELDTETILAIKKEKDAEFLKELFKTAKLTKIQKEILIMKAGHSLSFGKIAKLLKKSKFTIATHYKRAIKKVNRIKSSFISSWK